MTSERLTQFTNGPYTFDVIDSGPLDGTPVVLLHGFPQRAPAGTPCRRTCMSGPAYVRPRPTRLLPRARPKSRFAYGTAALTSDIVALIDAIGTDRCTSRPTTGRCHRVGGGWQPPGPRLVPDRGVGAPPRSVHALVLTSRQLQVVLHGPVPAPVPARKVLGSGRGDALLRKGGMTKEMVAHFHSEIVDYGALPGGLGYYRSIFQASPGSSARRSRRRRRTSGATTTSPSAQGAETNERWTTGPYEFEISRARATGSPTSGRPSLPPASSSASAPRLTA